jgi:3-oxoacyl-[acyl-carrier-protein] synthase II
VITGLGAVNAIGKGVPEVEVALRAGRPGGGPITLFDASESPVKIAAEVKDFDPTIAMDKKTARRTDRFCQLAVAAAREAVDHASLDIEPEADRIGAAIATGIGGLGTLQTAHEHLFTKGIERFSPFWVPALIPNMGAAFVSMELGTRGPLSAQCTACAASAMTLGDALLYIRSGMADVMVEVGR